MACDHTNQRVENHYVKCLDCQSILRLYDPSAERYKNTALTLTNTESATKKNNQKKTPKGNKT